MQMTEIINWAVAGIRAEQAQMGVMATDASVQGKFSFVHECEKRAVDLEDKVMELQEMLPLFE